MSEGVSQTAPQLVLATLGGSGVAIQIDTTLFSVNTVFRACYKFTDCAYVFIGDAKDGNLIVTLHPKKTGQDSLQLAGELSNELIDQKIREDLAHEAASVREMIVAQAFAEGNLLDEARDEGDYRTDTEKIGRRR